MSFTKIEKESVLNGLHELSQSINHLSDKFRRLGDRFNNLLKQVSLKVDSYDVYLNETIQDALDTKMEDFNVNDEIDKRFSIATEKMVQFLESED